MSDVLFHIPGRVTPWGRTGGRGTARFTPANVRSYQGVIKMVASDAMGDRPLLDGPLILDVQAVWRWPKSVSAKRRLMVREQFKKSIPDIDNVAKVFMDALNGIVWTDDARIAVIHGSKKFGDKPGVTVRVMEIV